MGVAVNQELHVLRHAPQVRQKAGVVPKKAQSPSDVEGVLRLDLGEPQRLELGDAHPVVVAPDERLGPVHAAQDALVLLHVATEEDITNEVGLILRPHHGVVALYEPGIHVLDVSKWTLTVADDVVVVEVQIAGEESHVNNCN